MITFFTIPRPFVGEFDQLQRMAIESWRGAMPGCHIVLLGDDPTVAGVAVEMGTKNGVFHAPSLIEQTPEGRPVANSTTFRLMENFNIYEFSGYWLCFLSADIILGADLLPALDACAGIARPFIIGQRHDIDPGAPKESATLHSPAGVDYFIYRPGTIPTEQIPPFIVSGGGGDNWFVWKACTAWNMTVIDATQAITAIHVNHSHPEWPNGKAGRQGSPEQLHNHRLARECGCNRWLGVQDAPWVLGVDGVIRERKAVVV